MTTSVFTRGQRVVVTGTEVNPPHKGRAGTVMGHTFAEIALVKLDDFPSNYIHFMESDLTLLCEEE